eukprot:TRINITY_DN9157_c0_g1_i2.p1 TRINITY_DN9157_c0_g1~~TRINITY_DN9157_c0_g1_i2.p1  ORF type:complete len:274 (+),score=63.33 TRINITY_DN9157_c0_g1_i2:45-824(+)
MAGRWSSPLAAALLPLASAQPFNALPFDPRHQFDKRCPPAVAYDPPAVQRDPTSTSSYLWTSMAANATAADCAELCCHDWSCEAFAFFATGHSGGCTHKDVPCCIFKDDIDALVTGAAGVTTGTRGLLPAKPAPVPNSTAIGWATLHDKLYLGINGDEFPITWGKDGAMYTGAGDNHQQGGQESPLSFFRVVGGPTEMGCTDPQPSPRRASRRKPPAALLRTRSRRRPARTSRSRVSASPCRGRAQLEPARSGTQAYPI